MKEITAIILAKNEEKDIARALTSVLFCKEVIVIDDSSSDATGKIARSLGAKVYEGPETESFSRKREQAQKNAQHQWILFLDADEAIDNKLRKEILDLPDNNSESAYYIKRRDYWWGRELQYGETMKIREKGIIRLLKRGSGSWKGAVHEEYMPGGRTGKLNGFINHFPHQTVKEFIADVNRYSTLRAKELASEGRKPSLFELVGYPFFKFFVTYVIYRGFMDGSAGFIYSFLMSFHSFLVRAKLYQYTVLNYHND